MRTAGQGQAAVPRERVRRRRRDGLPEPSVLGREITSYGLSRKWSAIQRSPAQGWGRPVLPWGALPRTAVLFCAKWGSVCPQIDTRSIPVFPPAGEKTKNRAGFF